MSRRALDLAGLLLHCRGGLDLRAGRDGKSMLSGSGRYMVGTAECVEPLPLASIARSLSSPLAGVPHPAAARQRSTALRALAPRPARPGDVALLGLNAAATALRPRSTRITRNARRLRASAVVRCGRCGSSGAPAGRGRRAARSFLEKRGLISVCSAFSGPRRAPSHPLATEH